MVITLTDALICKLKGWYSGPPYFQKKVIPSKDLPVKAIGKSIKVGGMIQSFKKVTTKKGDMMAETRPRHENFVFLHIILLPDREKLYERINRRVDDMVDEGLVDETRSVLSSDFGEALRSCKIVGYHELIDHFDGHITLAEAINLIKRNTRRFAKRQFTWFKAVKNAQVINALGLNSISAAEGLISSFLKP